MIVVVTNTSPVRSLAVLELLNLLPNMYGEVLLPPAVAAELAVDAPGFGPVNVEAFTFF